VGRLTIKPTAQHPDQQNAIDFLIYLCDPTTLSPLTDLTLLMATNVQLLSRLFLVSSALSLTVCSASQLPPLPSKTSNLCEPLDQIVDFPLKAEIPTKDSAYMYFITHRVETRDCLVELILAKTPINNPRSSPVDPVVYTLGHLAFSMLIRQGHVKFEEPLPAHVRKLLPARGAAAFYEWFELDGSRDVLVANVRAILRTSVAAGETDKHVNVD
jgi:hypothetical protein